MVKRVIRAGQIERVLANLYSQYLSQIRADDHYPWDLVSLKSIFGDRIYAATRKAVTEVYKEGTDYVGYKLKIDTYTTDTDIANIKDQTDKAVGSFWGRITEDAKRSREQEVETIKRPDRDTESFLDSTATSVATIGLAVATVSKTTEVIDQIVGRPQLQWHSLPGACPICSPLNGNIYDADDPTIPVPGENGSGGTHTNCRCYIEML